MNDLKALEANLAAPLAEVCASVIESVAEFDQHVQRHEQAEYILAARIIDQRLNRNQCAARRQRIVGRSNQVHLLLQVPVMAGSMPAMQGVKPTFSVIHALNAVEGRLLVAEDEASSPEVCVLGQSAKINLLGFDPAVGRKLKVNDTWLEVVDVLAEQVGDGGTGVKIQDRNNTIFIPLTTFQYRFWDSTRFLKDELDGVDVRLRDGVDSVQTAKVVTAILTSTHRNIEDYVVTIPAALLEQQKKTQGIFTYVMLAIAAISLILGGIGTMNIVLATVMERTHEIGIRRAIGARRVDIVRHFLNESVETRLSLRCR